MSYSAELFAKAKQIIPGGVNSPVRSFNAVDGQPPFINRGQGAYLFDEDGRRYIDYVGSWGPLILGHTHPEVVAAAQQAITHGMSFGAPTAYEVALAELITQIMPSIEMVRMVNSGTEATMSAIRLARGFTARDKIVKFTGCYHGHADCLLVKAGSGLLTFSLPNSAGVPEDFVKHTFTASYNNLAEVTQLFEQFGEQIAAIIIEPVACNMNCVIPERSFLHGLRALCDQYGSILIFDEVITGFRIGLGGAQEYFGVKPDLTTLGKIIGGGMPVGAYGGAAAIMQHLAPVGPVYQAGTLSGNPVAMAAGLATLKALQKNSSIYEELRRKTTLLVEGLRNIAEKTGVAMRVQQVESIFGIFFCNAGQEINSYDDVAKCDITLFKRFFKAMLEEGIYLAPSAFEAGFISLAHTDADINKTLEVAERVLTRLALTPVG